MFGIARDGRNAIAMNNLAKDLITTAHAAGTTGADESKAREQFRRHGASDEGFPAFLQCMTSQRLLERDAKQRLHPTARGLAYAGIDPRGH